MGVPSGKLIWQANWLAVWLILFCCYCFVLSYLGVKVGSNMNRICEWDDIISKVSSRLSKWKLKTLSIGGRLTLLKSSNIFIPPLSHDDLQSSVGKATWFNWDKALASKKNGGLGVSSFFAQNRALLFKWVWRFYTDKSSLWSSFIKAMHGSHGAIGRFSQFHKWYSTWRDIFNDSAIWKAIGFHSSNYGRAIRFRGFQVGLDVASKHWTYFLVLFFQDRWSWSLDGAGMFSVKSTRVFIDDRILPVSTVPTRWIKLLPIKINVFAWKVSHDALPTRLQLSLSGWYGEGFKFGGSLVTAIFLHIVSVVGSDAPSDYQIAPRSEPPKLPTVGSVIPPQSITSQLGLSPITTTTSPPTQPSLTTTTTTEKKKRGRPRKYAEEGFVRKALSPKPISSAAPPPPPVIDFSAAKRGKIRPTSAGKVQQVYPVKEIEPLGDWVSSSVGANFMPHIINVNTGEDVTMKVISFSQQGPRAICILSANGVISSVTLRQPDSSGGTLTYEGRFEILSLAGSFIPSESGGIRNRSGGMSVSLSSPDGRVVGGSVAGLLVAASPVQIIVGSFLTGVQQEQKSGQKPKLDNIAITIPTTAAVPVSVPVSLAVPVPVQAPAPAPTPAPAPETNESFSAKQNLTSPTFRGDNWSSYNAPESRNKPTDINVSLQ
ncbi:AT-hook motif nuclear-localized protein 1-like protein [Tanacetum coccineum]